MKNHQRSILISVGVLALVALGYFILTNDNEQYNWSETYTQSDKDPYDTYVISEMLKSYFPAKNFKTLNGNLDESLPVEGNAVSNYVFIGDRMYIDSLERSTLLEFVENGNQAFISATQLPEDLVTSLYSGDCYNEDFELDEDTNPDDYNYWMGLSTYHSSRVGLQFSHPKLLEEEDFDFKHRYRNKERKYFWKYIDDETFCEDAMNFEILGRIGLDSLNFIRIPFGKGYFYLHTTPIVFTNYQMIEKHGLAYAGKAFSHLPEGDIYWDELSKTFNYPEGNTPRSFSQGPLQYILSQKSLRWSWYTGMALLILYVLFRAKRRQRIIPVLPENTNTSLEYVRTIGRLYYQQNEHKKLAHQEMKLFLYYLRDHYNIPTQTLDDNLIRKVAVKSEVPVEDIRKIIKTWNKIEKSPNISEHTLIFFHGKIDDFYRTSK